VTVGEILMATKEELKAQMEELRKKIDDAQSEKDNASNEDDENGNTEDDIKEETTDADADVDGSDNKNKEKDKNKKEDSELEVLKQQFKEKMDALDKKLKDTQAELKDTKKREREAEIEAMKSAGKDKEALEAQISDMNSELETLRGENVSLRRDNAVDASLSTAEFRNDRARASARRDIVDSLIQDDSGRWVSRDGKDIESTVSSYLEDEENRFLFKPKQNTGSSTTSMTSTSVPQDKPKSIFDVPQDQMIAQTRKKLGVR